MNDLNLDLGLGRHLKTPFSPLSVNDLLAIGIKVDFGLVSITVDLAKEILNKCNADNRPLNKGHVKTLADAMSAGTWVKGTNHLAFSSSGRLMDGQHRLSAMIQADCANMFGIVFNMVEEAFDILDSNKKRSQSDVLSIHGYKNAKTLSSIIRKVNHYKTSKGNMWGIKGCDNVTTRKIADTNPYCAAAASLMDSSRDYALYGNKSDFGACYCIFSDRDAHLAKEFMKFMLGYSYVFEGKDYSVLFNSLKKSLTAINLSRKKNKNGPRADPHESESRFYYVMFDAWNAFVAKDSREVTKRIKIGLTPLIESWE